MHKSHVFISTLLLSSQALSAAAASLSQPGPDTSHDPFSIPDGNVIESSPVPLATSVPFPYRNILFDFTFLGGPIPRREVENVLTSADEAITDLVDTSPFESITNNRFEHRAPGGNTLISIQANVGKRITWAQLFRLLHGLYRFMIGMGVPQQHCQELDFTIALAGQERVGLGVVRQFPSNKDRVQKRGTKPASNTPLNDTILHLPSESSLLSASTLNTMPILWRIPRTSLVLSFDFFGMPIPERKVKATLQGAMAEVRPWSTSEDNDEAIDNDAFDWTLPPSGDGTRTGVTVLVYPNCVVTWEQLSQILFGLYQFTTALDGNAEKHFQVLGFRIVNKFGVKLGVGTLSYYPRRLLELEKRKSDVGQDSLQLTNSTSAVAAMATRSPVLWSVRDTNIVLDLVFFGQDIPTLEINKTLCGAQDYIEDVVRQQPNASIMGGRFDFKPNDSDAYINVITTQDKRISWLELSQILFGLMQFCGDKSHQVLVFDIDIQGVRVAFGTLLYFEPDPPSKVEKHGINGTLNVPNLVAGSATTSYNIPNTKDYLNFHSLGKAIPKSKVLEAISFTLQDISAFVQGIPDSPVPRNRYVYDDGFGISINILPSNFIKMTWSQLDKVLTGLMCFVTGVNPRPGGNLETHYQALAFNIVLQDQGYIGAGLLNYKPSPRVEVEKRVAVDNEVTRDFSTSEDLGKRSLANNSLLSHPQQTGGDFSPGNAPAPDIDLSDIHFPIINTSITLVFTKLGAHRIPIDTVSDLFDTVTEDIQTSVATKSNSAIPGPLWYFKVESARGAATLSISIYTRNNHKLTWQQLKKILSGLQLFMTAQRCSLNFDIDIANDVEVAKGVIWYSPPRTVEINTAAKRATITATDQLPHPNNKTHNPALSLPNPAANPIPYPVPSTPLDLTIYLNGPTIHPIYLSAYLTTALSHIRHNATTIPNAPIPWNEYRYSDGMSGLTINYLGYADTRWLTWRQLSWILRGILRFVSERETNCRAMAVEVDIRGARFGGLILWYVEVEEEA